MTGFIPGVIGYRATAGSGAVVGVGADGDIECVQDGGNRVERDN